MTLTQLFSKLYHYDVQLLLDNGYLKLKYKQNLKESKEIIKLKQQIKNRKKDLIKRLDENNKALNKNFLIYNDGDLYEYRYGFNSFLFIERLDDNLTDCYRLNFRKDDPAPYRVVILTKNVPFDISYKKALGFIEWLNRRK